MPDREKVIKGLEVCISREPGKYTCNKCPYETDGNDCEIKMSEDALALLREREPRVMTQAEVQNSKPHQDGAVWIETVSGGLAPGFVECVAGNEVRFLSLYYTGKDYIGWFSGKYYGETWRCWTARPTDEQREAVKWDA